MPPPKRYETLNKVHRVVLLKKQLGHFPNFFQWVEHPGITLVSDRQN